MISPMATQLTHCYFFLPSHEFAAVPEPRLCQFRVLPRRSLIVAASASSPNKTSARVASRKQPRTNADICNDLREFISEIGLPDGHVPSLKELSKHGRQDLANIVRRRGYKLIKELLAASQEVKVFKNDVGESLTDEQDKPIIEEDESTGLDEKAEDVFLSNEDIIMEETSITKTDTKPDVESFFSVESSTKPSLQEKVMNFIQSGELEAIEGDDLDVVNVKENSGSQNSMEADLSLANGSVLSSVSNVEIGRKEDQAEINRIKVMLHHKELELSQLKEHIEKNKQALFDLQAKAETEISKAQKLVLDKDAELLAAEESLSGLKHVQVDYWGEGESVEVAGSFNGWHHGVKLEPQPSSNIIDPPVELRNCRLWRSMLWLYPGIYEIKFVVDGKWMIDPMKEVVTRGSIHNNVLRVDK